MKSDDIYLARMCDAIGKIRRTTQGLDAEAFAASEQAVASVILWLTQIGEIAKRLSRETKARVDAPWKQIAGFRDVAVRDYFDLSVRDVWLTATTDISALASALDCAADVATK